MSASSETDKASPLLECSHSEQTEPRPFAPFFSRNGLPVEFGCENWIRLFLYPAIIQNIQMIIACIAKSWLCIQAVHPGGAVTITLT